MKYIMLALILLSLACSKKEDSSVQLPAPVVTDRYQLVQLGTFRRDQYLLDKQTGQLWTISCMASTSKSGVDCDYTAFMKVDVEGLNGITSQSISSWAKIVKETPKGGK